IQLIKSPEQGISRLALDDLPNLVSDGNNTAYICTEATAFARQSKDVGIPRRICEQGLKVNFEVMVQELATCFPTRDVGIPTRILTGLIEYLSANPETIRFPELLSKTEYLVDLCEDHNPTHAQIQAKCETLR